MVEPTLPRSSSPTTRHVGSVAVTSSSTTANIGDVNPTKPQVSAQAQNLSKLENLINILKTSGSITAQIKGVETFNKASEQLLAKVNPSLAQQVTQHTATAASKTTAGNTLYLVKLAYQQQSLTTVTTTPFKTGDKLQLQLNPQQQIIIKPSATTLQPEIINALRQVLPQQQNTSQLLNTVKLLQSLPQELQQTLVSKPVLAELKTLSTFIPTEKNSSLIQTQGIRNTLLNSGIFLENKLQNQQSIQGDLRVTLDKLQKIIHTETPTLKNNTLLPTKALDIVLPQLIQYLTTAPLARNNPEGNLQNLTGLLQLFGIKTLPTKSITVNTVRELINQQISKVIQATQEKIHFNQLRTLQTETTTEGNNIRLPSLHLELPLRWGEQILPLHLSIQEQVEEKPKDQEEQSQQNENNITRRWQVFLSFDLPNDEQLFTQLIIIEDSVSATVWTESQSLCDKAKQQLQTLRESFLANGLQVDDLHCIKGKPPSQELSLDYNLVDITT